MKSTHELQNEIRCAANPGALTGADFAPPALTDYLERLLPAHGLSVREAIRRCNLERTYGYQLFNGRRRPTRTVLLRLALVLGLEEDEVQRLLKLAGRPVLYARSRADAAVLYGLSHKLSLEETDELLTVLGEESLL